MDTEAVQLLDTARQESNVLEQSKILNYLHKDKDVRVKDIAASLSLPSPTVSQIMRLQKVPLLVVDGYLSETISLTHLYAISRLPDESSMVLTYEEVLKCDLNTSQTEELIRAQKYHVPTEGIGISKEDVEELTVKLTKNAKDVNAKVIQTQRQARVEIVIKGSKRKTTEFLKNLEGRLTD